ncbi:MAG: type II toxin-antitoxin system RelE/ParE family toxin [Leptospiraceae bacterium]|nr:type II toxin-antitoxin system RelE/ParE family toxin [Leptospiraceae bacterium]
MIKLKISFSFFLLGWKSLEQFLIQQNSIRIILTHGFIKKDQKIPARELEKARIARREYES